MSEQQDKPMDAIEDWILFDEAYADFVMSHPAIGLSMGASGPQNLRRNFGERLLAAGVARRLVNRRWLAHRERFGPALFELLTRAPSELVDQVRARQAAA